jgi:hypothetical protein
MNEGDCESCMTDILIEGNILRYCGYGWGQQRHNKQTPAHIKSWNYENKAKNFVVKNNIFEKSAYRMLHFVAKEEKSCPTLYGNTYIQYIGGKLGEYGSNVVTKPENLDFDENVKTKINSLLKDKTAIVIGIKD